MFRNKSELFIITLNVCFATNFTMNWSYQYSPMNVPLRIMTTHDEYCTENGNAGFTNERFTANWNDALYRY